MLRRLLLILAFLCSAAPADAAFTFVRSVGTVVTSTGTAVSLVVGASGAASGDLVVVACGTSASTASTSVTDTAGNTYTLGTTTARSGIALDEYASTLTGALVSGNSITCNYAGSSTVTVAALEFTGGTGSATTDVVNSGNVGGDNPPTSSITTVASNDVVVAVNVANAISSDDTPIPTNYLAGASKLTATPSMYMVYSIISGTATRAWGINQWSLATPTAAAIVNVSWKLTGTSTGSPTRSLLGVGTQQ